MTIKRPGYKAEESDDDTASTAPTLAPTLPQTPGNSNNSATVETHPLPDKEGLIIRVQPPQAPVNEELTHVPCDIVLVIDVSGSMSREARFPGGAEEEYTGLSILDLVKHACRTILSTLDEGDRLALITFSSTAKQVLEMTAMTDANKDAALEKIKAMRPESATNLWAGLKMGIQTLRGEDEDEEEEEEEEENHHRWACGRVPAVLVLTDGEPNHMCPAEGYIPRLRAMGDITPVIHTFGFGYAVRSGLLKSVAEHGRGNYAFICDAGMIGTVFVNAVAHLQSTFATRAVLRVTYPGHMALEQTSGLSLEHCEPKTIVGQDTSLTVSLGNIQFGQSRDIHVRWKSMVGEEEKNRREDTIQATLEYQSTADNQKRTSTSVRHLEEYTTTLTSAEIAYHISRHQILHFLASIFPIDPISCEHSTRIPMTHRTSLLAVGMSGEGIQPPPSEALHEKQEALRALVATIPAARFPADPQCVSLMLDLVGPAPYGQITTALSTHAYFKTWGQHFLPSLHGAHARQLCNSFKDPGPLQYGTASPLFLACRNALSTAFDNLPPPAPAPAPHRVPSSSSSRTLSTRRRRAGGENLAAASGGQRCYRPTTSMSEWNNRASTCFAAHTLVALAGAAGERRVRIAALVRGARVQTPRGPRTVAAVVATPVRRAEMVVLHGVLVTPWHPVLLVGGGGGAGGGWVFPADASPAMMRVRYTGCVYSVLLQRDADVDAHAIMVGDGAQAFWGVTLGHGMLRGSSDPRAHPFFGSYGRVVGCLKGAARHASRGRYFAEGGLRSSETGLVCGLRY